MITLHGLSKSFGSTDVLRTIDLAITPGKVTGIVGPNGAGKSTLIKLILGLARPDRGEVHFDGVSIEGAVEYRARIGYMPQIARFPENLTGAELIAMMTDLRGSSRPIDDELIRRFALAEHLEKPLRTLSGGTRQKVNAALAFAFTPHLLILDEPTAGLDPVAAATLKDKIFSCIQAGATVIITSHIMAELEEVCDNIVFLLDGGVRYAGSVVELKVTTRERSLERAVATMMIREVA